MLKLLAGISVLAALFTLAGATLAASVVPEFIDVTSNQTCSEFAGPGQTWNELKVDPNPEGAGPFVYSDTDSNPGPLVVTITNADDKSFDWSANIGVDAVYVKAGSGGSNLYRYDPPAEVTSDTDLQSPGEQGNGISHISFCYDAALTEGSPTPTPTPTATPTPTPTPAGGGEGVAGGTPRASAGALPNTGTASQPVSGPVIVASVVLLASLGALAFRRLSDDRLRRDR